MMKGKTVFVLGAGASAEFNMPVGWELAEKIKSKVDIKFRGYNECISGDLDLFTNITNQFQNNVTEYQNAAWRIRDGIGLSFSIDDFLDSHKDDSYLSDYGRAAIVRTILECEQTTSLHSVTVPRAEDNVSTLSTWLNILIKILSRGYTPKTVDKIFEDVTFINFNYDRCLEVFLSHALAERFSISEDDSRGIVANAAIYHPYGTVGNLWSGRSSVSFGQKSANYSYLAKNINIYTDDISDNGTIKLAQDALERCDALVFLGFAFHVQNIRLISTSKRLMYLPETIIASTFQCSKPSISEFDARIRSIFPGLHFRKSGAGIMFQNGECKAVMADHAAFIGG